MSDVNFANIVKSNVQTGTIEFPLGGIGDALIVGGALRMHDGTEYHFGDGKLRDFDFWAASKIIDHQAQPKDTA